MARKKPLGIVLISLYSSLWGAAMLPLGCLSSLAAGLPAQPAQSAYNAFLGYLALAFGAAMLTSAYGLWTTRPWAVPLSIWAGIVSIIVSVLALAGVLPGYQDSPAETGAALVSMALTAAMIRYLISEQVVRFYDETALDHWHPHPPHI